MRTVITNHFIAFTSPSHPGVFRFSFETDAPDVALARLNTESIVPITIYLTKEVEVNADTKNSWAEVLLECCKPLRPGSQWGEIKPNVINAIFGTHLPIVAEPPPFREHMLTDEGRSRSTESDCKQVEGSGLTGVDESEEEDVAATTVPADIKVPNGATWTKPTSKGYLRNLWQCFPDGAEIWHARPAFACGLSETGVPHPGGWFGRYESSSNSIIGVADGKKYNTISAFANAHYELHGREKQNGWDTCKYRTKDGAWKDAGKIKESIYPH